MLLILESESHDGRTRCGRPLTSSIFWSDVALIWPRRDRASCGSVVQGNCKLLAGLCRLQDINASGLISMREFIEGSLQLRAVVGANASNVSHCFAAFAVFMMWQG